MRSLCESLRLGILLFLVVVIAPYCQAAEMIWGPQKFQTPVTVMGWEWVYTSTQTNQQVCDTSLGSDPEYCNAFTAIRSALSNRGLVGAAANVVIDSGVGALLRRTLVNAYRRGFRIIDLGVTGDPRDHTGADWEKNPSAWITQIQNINDSLYSIGVNSPMQIRLTVMFFSTTFLSRQFTPSLANKTQDMAIFNKIQNHARVAARYSDSLRVLSPSKFVDLTGTTDTAAFLNMSITPLNIDSATNVNCMDNPTYGCSDSGLRKYFSSLKDLNGSNKLAKRSTLNLSVDDVHLWIAGYTGWLIDSYAFLLDSLRNKSHPSWVTPIHSIVLRTTVNGETTLYPEDDDRKEMQEESPPYVLSFPNADPSKNLVYDRDTVRGYFSKERTFFRRREDLFIKMCGWFNASVLSHLGKHRNLATNPLAGIYYQASNMGSYHGALDFYRVLALSKIGFVVNSMHAWHMGGTEEHQIGLYASMASIADSIKKITPNFTWQTEYSSPFVTYANGQYGMDPFSQTFLLSVEGQNNGRDYFAQTQGAMKLGASGVSYANWGPSMMNSPPNDPVWTKVIGKNAATDTVLKILTATKILPRSNVALLLPTDARIDEERDVRDIMYNNQKDFNRFMTKRIGNKRITYLTDSMVQASATPFAGIDTLYVFRRMAKSPAALPGFIKSVINKCPKRPKVKVLDFSYPSGFSVDNQYLPKFVPVSFSPQY